MKIAEKKVNLIFHVPPSLAPIYEKLSDFIEGSNVGELTDTSDNVVQLVKDNYHVRMSCH